jgi:hypothetical protein
MKDKHITMMMIMVFLLLMTLSSGLVFQSVHCDFSWPDVGYAVEIE